MMSFILPARVYLEDTDAQGVVYNASYFRFLERARTEWLRVQGIDHNQLQEEAGIMLVLAGIDAKFERPGRLDDMLHVRAALAEVTRVRFVFQQDVRRESPEGEVLCRAVATVACVSAHSGKPQRMPADLLADLRINEPTE